jgi:hypothetical protein
LYPSPCGISTSRSKWILTRYIHSLDLRHLISITTRILLWHHHMSEPAFIFINEFGAGI